MKENWNPKSKNEFVGSQYRTTLPHFGAKYTENPFKHANFCL